MKHARLKAGSWAQLTCDVNAIPAGVYKIFSIENDMIYFCLHRKKGPIFAIHTAARELLKSLPAATALKQKTHRQEFFERYYVLFEKLQKNEVQSSPYMTMCSVIAEDPRELH